MASLLSFVLFIYTVYEAASTANLVLLTDEADKKGAVCLDGTPGGYYLRHGSGRGATKWLLHQQGGGWCYNEKECVERSKTPLGSSTSWPKTASFAGLLSPNGTVNPDFYDWNVAYLKYCDGASFSGDVTNPVHVGSSTIYFRGKRLLRAALDDLFSRGMKSATDVILTGCSAGGLATYLHADYVNSVLSPQTAPLKAIADAGYFLDAKNWTGQEHIRPLYQYVFQMQNCSGGVNQECIRANKGSEWKCFFAQYTFPFLKTPIFQFNSMYDTWQIPNILQVTCKFPDDCPRIQQEAVLGYRETFLDDSMAVSASSTSGMFLPSCLQHCMSLSDDLWTKILVGGLTAVEAFSKWYFETGPLHLIDGPYPCNPTCP